MSTRKFKGNESMIKSLERRRAKDNTGKKKRNGRLKQDRIKPKEKSSKEAGKEKSRVESGNQRRQKQRKYSMSISQT